MQAEQITRLSADPRTGKDAMIACLLTHSLKLDESRRSHPLFKTTTSAYGSRAPLEMFGPSDHAIRATRSKEPVGNGTRVYTR